MAGTVGVADIYGGPSRVGGASDPMAVQNRNGSSVAPISQTASGAGVEGGTGPAVAWVGLVVSIVMLRVALHLLARAD